MDAPHSAPHFTFVRPISRLAVLLATALAFVTLSGTLSADVVEVSGGSRLVGTIKSITDGSVVIDTDYAGEVTVKQDSVTSLTTDEAVAVRLASGTRAEGRISTAGGSLQIAAAEGNIGTSVGQVAALWAAGTEDPQILALERHWKYEASVDIVGRSGNKSQLGSSAGFRATLAGPRDTLVFSTSYDRQISDGVKSADQFRAGLDYSSKFRGDNSWYVRDEGGFDRIKDIRFYNVAAAGFGYGFIAKEKHTLTGRLGLSYRSENYGDPATEDVSALGLDIGLEHSLEFDSSRLINRISYVPSFNDFSNYRITHESSYEIPLANPAWKLRLGVNNDYNSRPGPGIDRLDTSYFTRLILNWD